MDDSIIPPTFDRYIKMVVTQMELNPRTFLLDHKSMFTVKLAEEIKRYKTKPLDNNT